MLEKWKFWIKKRSFKAMQVSKRRSKVIRIIKAKVGSSHQSGLKTIRQVSCNTVHPHSTNFPYLILILMSSNEILRTNITLRHLKKTNERNN